KQGPAQSPKGSLPPGVIVRRANRLRRGRPSPGRPSRSRAARVRARAPSAYFRKNAPHVALRPVVTATLKLCVKSHTTSLSGRAMYAGIGNTWPATLDPTGVPRVGMIALKGHSCGLVFAVELRAVSWAPQATASSPAVPTTFGAMERRKPTMYSYSARMIALPRSVPAFAAVPEIAPAPATAPWGGRA